MTKEQETIRADTTLQELIAKLDVDAVGVTSLAEWKGTKLEETASAIILFLCATGDMPIESLSGANVYIYPELSLDGFGEQGPIEERPLFIASSGEGNNESGEQSLVAICPASSSVIEEWRDSVYGIRPSDYKEFKESSIQEMMAYVEASCPELKGHVRCVDCATPLTIRDFTNR